MDALVEYFSKLPEVQALHRGLSKRLAQQSLTGVTGTARRFLYAGLYRLGHPLFIATHSMQAAETVMADVAEMVGRERVLLFPERELSHSDILAFSPELAGLRMKTLGALVTGTPCIVISTIRGMLQPLLPPEVLRQSFVHLQQGQRQSFADISERMVFLGYERADLVETKGQFSIRGGLLDIYPLDHYPIRIEWFDDEIDSIRNFDPETQRSSETLKEVFIWPAREWLMTNSELSSVADRVESELTQHLDKMGSEELRANLRHTIERDIERMRAGIHHPGLLRYARFFHGRRAHLIEYAAPDTVMVYDEPTRLRETMERVAREEAEWTMAALERGEILPNLIEEVDLEQVFHAPQLRQLFVNVFARHTGGSTTANVTNIPIRPMQQFHGQMPLLKSEVMRFTKMNQHIVFFAGSEERAERLTRVLEDFSISGERKSDFDPGFKMPMVLIGNLMEGFELPAAHLVVITENEVFVTKHRARRVRADATEAAKIKSYQDLHIGDYVVHISHGVGRYVGIETLVIDGKHRDYLNIRYAGNDKVFVPVDQINLVQKYLGSEEREPRVNHLGGSDWARTKNKVKHSVQDIAQDLIKLYAQREATTGHAFAADTEWQKDFETMFPYEETPDQLRAIREIKLDMERSRPMDRLLCGDVGYGKTEVAIRAASKAVFDGKQVAVLVPTTILAQQHFETFKERFDGFPVTVEVLSRFRSKGEAKKVADGLRVGAVDIVIGTHRLLQKSIIFKDLGLLVVDEEQRFGVSHKEKLKQLRNNIDCLTLTATPIPRTLHMSMVGVRDLSVIETPPENRFPVQTYVVEYSDSLLREAIEREIGRGGQVYVLYNQVKGIAAIADRVMRLVPEARVAIGHGQMDGDELESVMLGFLQGETDVLVSTTIIETGLDIPNVNTLVVFHADHMGLAQLYQLRGRVGRSNRIAYAYFTYQPDKVLAEVAEKRLQAIKEFTELGSGFKIAMRDLAIRGAGNLLGAEQHGFISAVGFDMYTDMLAEAVRELRGEPITQRAEPTVEVTMDAYLPDTYISDGMQKIEMYKKFVAALSLMDVDDLHEEIEDRYGEIPREVHNLLGIARIRAYAFMYDLASIIKQDHDMQIAFREEQNDKISGLHLFELTQLYPKRMRLAAVGGIYTLTVEGRGKSDEELLTMVLNVLKELPRVFEQQEELQNAKSIPKV